MAAVLHPFLAAAVTATSSFVVSVLTLWYVEKSQETWKMNRQMLLVVSRRRRDHQSRHDLYLLRAGSGQGLGGDPHQQHRALLLAHLRRALSARRRARHLENRPQRHHDHWRRGADYTLEI